ncbi:uncharacterized protein METZ01_LOCUS320894, partial [marine metagenome]
MALILALAVPLIGAVLIGLTGRHPNLRESVTLITAAILLITVLIITQSVLSGGRPSVVLFNLIPNISIAFRAEPLG